MFHECKNLNFKYYKVQLYTANDIYIFNSRIYTYSTSIINFRSFKTVDTIRKLKLHSYCNYNSNN